MSGRRRDHGGEGIADRRLMAGFVLLVGLSGGLMAVQGGAPAAVVAVATAGGLVAGGLLLWYLLRIAT